MPISHICHRDGACGEKSVIWRSFRFLCMTVVEKSEIFPHNVLMLHFWGNLVFCVSHCFGAKSVLLKFTRSFRIRNTLPPPSSELFQTLKSARPLIQARKSQDVFAM